MIKKYTFDYPIKQISQLQSKIMVVRVRRCYEYRFSSKNIVKLFAFLFKYSE